MGALEQLDALQKGALKELDDKVRRLNKQISTLQASIPKLRHEEEQLQAAVQGLKKERNGLAEEIAEKRQAANQYRDDQIAKIEQVAVKERDEAAKLAKASTDFQTREQAAKAAEGKLQDLIEKVTATTGTLKTTIAAAVEKAIASLKE